MTIYAVRDLIEAAVNFASGSEKVSFVEKKPGGF